MKKILFICLALACPGTSWAQAYGAKTAGTQSMNPDIGVVVDFAARFTSGFRESEPDANRFKMRGAELVATQYIDAFGRLDFVGCSDGEALNVEEAYATIFELPLKTKMRVGKFFMPYGILNTYHTHDLPQVDRPLMLERFFGGEYSDTGAEGAWLVPNPWDLYSEITVAVANGDRIGSEEAVNTTPPTSGVWDNTGNGDWKKRAYVARWANFFSLSDEASLLVGGNFARGINAGNDSKTTFGGFDAKFRYVWPDMRKFTLQGEQMWWHEDQHFVDASGNVYNTPITPQGGYVYAEYEFLPKRWAFGTRGDWSGQRLFNPAESKYNDMSYEGSAYLTWTPSEFQRWRLQYRYSDFDTSGTRQHSNELMVQATFIIGFHPPHKF